MIEQGIVQLVQANAAVVAIAPVGGFFVELPKDQSLPSWAYTVVSSNPNTTLQSVRGLNTMHLQIDCFGNTAEEAILLAAAISDVLDGFHGVLTDPDVTPVDVCLPADQGDFFDDARRSYRRMLEYEILFNSN
jgi:ribosomal protein S11